MKTKRYRAPLGRPRIINPDGETRMVSFMMAAPLHERLVREANKRGISVSRLIRERLQG